MSSTESLNRSPEVQKVAPRQEVKPAEKAADEVKNMFNAPKSSRAEIDARQAERAAHAKEVGVNSMLNLDSPTPEAPKVKEPAKLDTDQMIEEHNREMGNGSMLGIHKVDAPKKQGRIGAIKDTLRGKVQSARERFSQTSAAQTAPSAQTTPGEASADAAVSPAPEAKAEAAVETKATDAAAASEQESAEAKTPDAAGTTVKATDTNVKAGETPEATAAEAVAGDGQKQETEPGAPPAESADGATEQVTTDEEKTLKDQVAEASAEGVNTSAEAGGDAEAPAEAGAAAAQESGSEQSSDAPSSGSETAAAKAPEAKKDMASEYAEAMKKIELANLERSLIKKAADKIRDKLKNAEASTGQPGATNPGAFEALGAFNAEDPEFKKMQELKAETGDIPSVDSLGDSKKKKYLQERGQRDAIDLEHKAMQEVAANEYRLVGKETPAALKSMMDGHDVEIRKLSEPLAKTEKEAEDAAKKNEQPAGAGAAAPAGGPSAGPSAAGAAAPAGQPNAPSTGAEAAKGAPAATTETPKDTLDKTEGKKGPETWADRNTPTFKRWGQKLASIPKNIKEFAADVREGFSYARAERAKSKFEKKNGAYSEKRAAYLARASEMHEQYQKDPHNLEVRRALRAHLKDGKHLDGIKSNVDTSKSKMDQRMGKLLQFRAKRSPAPTPKPTATAPKPIRRAA